MESKMHVLRAEQSPDGERLIKPLKKFKCKMYESNIKVHLGDNESNYVNSLLFALYSISIRLAFRHLSRLINENVS